MTPTTAKKTATPAATTTATPLARIQQKLNAEAAAKKAEHLRVYRNAVTTLAAGKELAAEEEEHLAAALKFFGLDTDAYRATPASCARLRH
jgi:hypothetical protein